MTETLNEIWKDIEGYEGKYQVSNLGQIKSLNYHREKREKVFNPRLDKDGYKVVTIRKNNIPKLVKIHRLVAQAFIPNPNNYPVVNHKNGCKQDAKVENLEWCTIRENSKHAFKTGLAEGRKGAKCNFYNKKGSKSITARKVKCITTNKEFGSIIEAAEFYNLKNNKTHITACCRGKLKSTGRHPTTGEKLAWEYI